jgi:hypothetical protein
MSEPRPPPSSDWWFAALFSSQTEGGRFVAPGTQVWMTAPVLVHVSSGGVGESVARSASRQEMWYGWWILMSCG